MRRSIIHAQPVPVVAGIVCLGALLAGCGSSGSAPATTSAASSSTSTATPDPAALSSYLSEAQTKVTNCVSLVNLVQYDMRVVLSGSATGSDLVTLYQDASRAKPACSYSITTFSNFSTPIDLSAYPSLTSAAVADDFAGFLHQWAESDNQKVLSDIETLANDPGSTSAIANLLTDSQQADADGAALQSAARAAAALAGIKGYKGLGLTPWDLHQK